MKNYLIIRIVIKMKNNLKIAFLFILIVIGIILIVKNVFNTEYSKNILFLILFFLSFYLGKTYEYGKKNKTEKTQTQPTSHQIPQEFKDEQKRFQELNKEEDFT